MSRLALVFVNTAGPLRAIDSIGVSGCLHGRVEVGVGLAGLG